MPQPLPDRLYAISDLITQEHEGALVIVNMRTATCIELDPMAAAFWIAISETDSTAAAVEAILAEYDVDRGTVEADMAQLVDHLLEAELLSPIPVSPPSAPREVSVESLRGRYLDLLERSLCGFTTAGFASASAPHLGKRSIGYHLDLANPAAMSMIGITRMRNVRDFCERAVVDGIPGDFMECGVWRGGVGIMMRAVLEAHGDRTRTVWMADSFAGLPVPDPTRDVDRMWAPMAGKLAVSLDDVRRNFAVYGFLDDQVRFLEGWFSDTLPTAPVESLAVLRLDGDLYDSVMDCLVHLWDKVSPGGFVIIDDYYLDSARDAVRDFFVARNLSLDIRPIDWTGVWFQKPSETESCA